MTENKPSPDSRSARTRQALLRAGLDLLAERPIDAIAIDEFVARAGVAKGSFFNHFADKPAFGGAVAAAVREEIERQVGARNAGVADPLERLVGGMCVAVEFALAERTKARVMLRGQLWSNALGHPLNAGVRADVEACVALGLVRGESRSLGVAYWLSLCQAMMIEVIEGNLDRPAAARSLREMLEFALAGLAVEPSRIGKLAMAAAESVLRG